MTGVDLDIEIGAWFATVLSDDQAAMKINKNLSVVRMEQGLITKVLYRTTEIRTLFAQGSYLFVVHYNGTMVQMRPEDGRILMAHHTGISDLRNYASHLTPPCDIDIEILVLVSHREVYTYNISSKILKSHVTNLKGAVSVTPGCVDGNVVYVVTERDAHKVHVYDATWSLMTSFGGKGTDNSQLNGPFSAVMSDQSYIFVSDYFNYRVSMFTSDGQFIKNIIIYDVPYYETPDQPWSLSITGKYLWVSTQNGRLTRYIL